MSWFQQTGMAASHTVQPCSACHAHLRKQIPLGRCCPPAKDRYFPKPVPPDLWQHATRGLTKTRPAPAAFHDASADGVHARVRNPGGFGHRAGGPLPCTVPNFSRSCAASRRACPGSCSGSRSDGHASTSCGASHLMPDPLPCQISCRTPHASVYVSKDGTTPSGK